MIDAFAVIDSVSTSNFISSGFTNVHNLPIMADSTTGNSNFDATVNMALSVTGHHESADCLDHYIFIIIFLMK